MNSTWTFNLVDAVFALVLLMGTLGGLKRGLSGELSRVAAMILALLAAWKLAPPCAGWAATQFGISHDQGYLFAAALIILVTLVGLFFLRRALRHVMDFAFKGRLEKVGGGISGFSRALVVAVLGLLVLGYAPHPGFAAAINEGSFCGRLVYRYVRPLYTDLRARHPGLGLPDPVPPPAASDLGETAPLEESLPALSDQPPPEG